jgi:zinc transport system substrate-binding protein
LKVKVLLFSLILFTGCFKRDDLENSTIYTTSYPLEYITNRLFGENSTVLSIYPPGTDNQNYKLTDKQIKEYSDGSLFIFNGLAPEKDYVADMLKHNKKMKIIDSTLSMEFENNQAELWLNPANFLMIAQNIRNGFEEYIDNHYLKEEILANYDDLKVEVSNLDAKIKMLAQSSSSKTIVVANDLFKFLEEKYGLIVYSLDEDTVNDKIKADVVSLIKSGMIEYVFVLNDTEKEMVNTTIEEGSADIIYLKSLGSISEEERNNKEDYISLMNYNIEKLREELFD